jgi:hypothetical protein
VCISCTVTRSTVTEHCFVVSTSRTGKLSRVVALGSYANWRHGCYRFDRLTQLATRSQGGSEFSSGTRRLNIQQQREPRKTYYRSIRPERLTFERCLAGFG